MAKKIRVTLKRSVNKKKPKQRATVAALGLHKINQVVEKESSPAILGMVRTVAHLVEVEVVN